MSKDFINENLVEIKKNIFVSKTDPDFLKKYVRYNPTDAEMNFQYAKFLESKGDTVNSFEYFTKAAELGNFKAKKILDQINSKPIIINEPKEEVKSNNNVKKSLLPLLLIPLLFIFGAILIYLLSNVFNYEKSTTNTTIENNNTTLMIPPDEPTKEEDLIFTTVLSSIEYYKKLNSVYPIAAHKLEGNYPENYISNFPSAFKYEKTGSGYKLSVEGMKEPIKNNGLINLVFFEKTNELALMKGTEVIKLYKTASGSSSSEKLPTTSLVTERVSMPNGGNGALGTRGLALTDNFAIHGTNDDSSIGKKVSSGCLRLTNSDIEELFTYVPLGTPFKVDTEIVPSEPAFSESLPPFPGISDSNELFSEQNPKKEYDWKK